MYTYIYEIIQYISVCVHVCIYVCIYSHCAKKSYISSFMFLNSILNHSQFIPYLSFKWPWIRALLMFL